MWCFHCKSRYRKWQTCIVIKNCIRKTDKLIRYGGDEFLLILSDMVRGTLRGKLLQIQDASKAYEALSVVLKK